MHTDKSSRIILDLYSLDLFWDLSGFASALGTPFSYPLHQFMIFSCWLQPPPILQTHPTLPKGKEQVTLLCQRLQQINSANEHQPPLVLKPILTFPKGRDKLLLRLIGFSPHLASPVGEGQLLCFVKDFFSQWHQPPPNLPRRGGTVTLLWHRLVDAGYYS